MSGKIMRRGLCFGVLSSIGLVSIFGQGVKPVKDKKLSSLEINSITTAVPFLLITPDSRAGGMGDVGAATGPDVNATHWNNAKIPFSDKQTSFGISFTPWLASLFKDIYLGYFSGYKKIDKYSAVSGSLRYFTLGTIELTDNVGQSNGTTKPLEFAIDGGYSRKLTGSFALGAAFRYVRSNLPISSGANAGGNSFSADVGAYYQNDKIKVAGNKSILSIGAQASNVGAKMSYGESSRKDFLPMNLRLGGGLRITPDEFNEYGIYLDFNKLLVPTPRIIDSTSVKKTPDITVVNAVFSSFSDVSAKEELREVNLSTGVEYWYSKQFGIRTGYFYEHPTKGNRSYLTFGASFKYQVLNIDMAYLLSLRQQNPLANTLRFSLSFNFDKASKSQDAPGNNDGDN
jgi:Type IX secretion system protein PorV